jgi:hypothetical protein
MQLDRPLALAAANPAYVRSRIKLRSNSASAPKMWKISLPELEFVSIASCKLLNQFLLFPGQPQSQLNLSTNDSSGPIAILQLYRPHGRTLRRHLAQPF